MHSFFDLLHFFQAGALVAQLLTTGAMAAQFQIFLWPGGRGAYPYRCESNRHNQRHQEPQWLFQCSAFSWTAVFEECKHDAGAWHQSRCDFERIYQEGFFFYKPQVYCKSQSEQEPRMPRNIRAKTWRGESPSIIFFSKGVTAKESVETIRLIRRIRVHAEA